MKDNDLQPNHPGQPEDEQGQAQEIENNQQDSGSLANEGVESIDSYPENTENLENAENSENSENSENANDETNPYSQQDSALPVMQTEGQPHDMQQPPADSGSNGGNGSKGWMIASLVLAAALVAVLIVPPFAKGSGNEAVAKVNDISITKDKLYDELVRIGGKQTLNNMITDELIQQELNKKSITVTDADVDKDVENLKASFPSESQFEFALQQNGLTLAQLKEQTKDQIQLRKLMSDQIEVTDEEVKAIYDQYKEDFATPELVRASHILVETKEEAQQIEKQLKEGADFAAIAKEKNQDATKDTGGDLDFFERGRMDPAFEEAAFKLKKGEISGPVKTSFGYHIIKVTDRKEATNPTFEDKKEEIRSTLENQKVMQQSSAYIQELKDKATISNTLDETPAVETTETPAADTE